MTPGIYDLTIYCGSSLDADDLSIDWLIDDVPVDLTGWAARACGRLPSGGVVFEWSTEGGTLVIDPTTHEVSPSVAAEQTSAMWRQGLPVAFAGPGKPLHSAGTWDLELVSPSGKVHRLLHGALRLSPEDCK